MMNALDISQTYFANAAAYSASALQNKDSAKEAAQDFEAFFLSRMCESMFEGVSTEGIFGGGHAEKVYRSLLLNEYGKIMAQNGGIGVADYVMDAIIQMQEAQQQQEV